VTRVDWPSLLTHIRSNWSDTVRRITATNRTTNHSEQIVFGLRGEGLPDNGRNAVLIALVEEEELGVAMIQRDQLLLESTLTDKADNFNQLKLISSNESAFGKRIKHNESDD
jgi:hypothetical protein